MSTDYTVNGKEYSMMSPANERILRKFVGHEFYCDMTQEVDYILRNTLQTGDYSDARLASRIMTKRSITHMKKSAKTVALLTTLKNMTP